MLRSETSRQHRRNIRNKSVIKTRRRGRHRLSGLQASRLAWRCFNRTDADSARIGECRLGALTYRGRRHADAVTPLPNWCRKLPGRLCRTPPVALSSADSAKGRHRVKHQKWQPLRRNLGGEGQLKRLTARRPLHDHAAYFFPGGSSPHLFWITAVGVSGFAAGAGALAAGSGGASGVAMAMPNSRHCPPAT